MKSENKLTRFLNGKGFYYALGACIIGAGAAAWVAVDQTLNSITQQNSGAGISSSSVNWGFSELQEAQRQEKDLEASSQQQSSSPSLSASDAEPTEQVNASAPSVPLSNGPFSLPVAGKVIGVFSNGQLVRNDTLKDWRTHDGVDIACAAGAQIQAIGDGTVSKIYQDGMWGTVVEIAHRGDLVSIYSGLDPNVMVKAGMAVNAKQVIGVLGTGNLAEMSMEPHLHFAVKQDGKFIDPLSLMDDGTGD